MTQDRQPAVAVVALDTDRQAAVSAILREQGYAVAVFADVDQAVAALDGDPPDLFVAGLSAPNLDGWRLCRLLRSAGHARFSDVPILLMSDTLTGEEAGRTTAELGGDGLLPFSADAGQVVDSVGRLLSKRHAKRPARRRAHQGVKERLRMLFSHMLDGCALQEMIWDSGGQPVDYRYLAVNPAFERMTGVSAAALLGKTVMEAMPATERHWIEAFGRVALTGESCCFEEYHAGLGKYLEVVAYCPAAGQVACVLRDITKRKEHQKRAERLDSLNELLSQVNQAIVRADSPEELFESACRIATRCGHFRLTWIGLLDEATGEIRQCAQDTDAQGFPCPIRGSECAVNRRTIAEGKPVICNTMSPSQSEADCHLRAMESDIRSCAAFPIRLRGKVCGTLCLHSSEEGFFQDAEVKRLEEVALDISFGLDALEADKARREVEERFTTVFEHFPAPAAISNYENSTYLEVNRQFEAVFGFSRGEVIGQPLSQKGPFSEKLHTKLAALLARQGWLSGEDVQLRAQDGRVVDCLLNVELIAVGGQRRALSMMVDVTERKQMEAALRESEATLRRLCDSALDAIVMVDGESHVILWNPAAEQMFGYTAPEIMGRPIHDLVVPAGARPQFQAGFPVFQRTGEGTLVGRVVELSGRRKDGSEFPMELSLAAVHKRQQWQAVAIIRDVTSRYDAGKQIEDANHRYALLAEQSRTIVWEVDTEGLYTYVGPVSEAVWGYRPEELAGKKHFYDIHPEEGREAFQAAAREVLSQKGTFRDLHNPVQCKDGRIVWVSTSGIPVLDDSGELVGYRGSNVDITERKRAEEESRLSERRYRSLFENMLSAFAYCKMVYDDQGRPVDSIYLEVNSVYERMLGVHDIVGKRVSDVIPGVHELCPELIANYHRVASTGKSERFEVYFTPTAQWRSVSVYSPEKEYFITVFDDISERKQNEADRETMVALLRLLNTANDTRELICAVTGLMREWSGCEAIAVRLKDGDDTQGPPVLECRCGEVLSGQFDPSLPCFTPGGSFWTNSTTKLLASTTEADRQSHMRHRCQNMGFESVALIPLCSSGETLGLLQFNDRRPDRFTPQKIAVMERVAASLAIALEQRKTQEALRSSEERYRLISDNTVDVIWLLDVDSGLFTYASPSVERLLGYTLEELLTKGIRDILTPESYPAAASRLAEVMASYTTGDPSRRSQVLQADGVRKDGSLVRIEVVGKILPNQRGRVHEILGVARDITERMEAEARLMQAQKMESVGRLAGGVAHDFNNLLTVINGYSELLLGDVIPGDPLRGRLEEIRKAGQRAAALTQQLLAFSRKQVLQPRLLDLNRVVADMRPMLARMVGEDVEVSVELHPEATTICADPHQLEQVLMNLAVNSRDAMPQGGKLSIGTAVVEWREDQPLPHPRAHPGSYVMLGVTDSGVGMDEETRQHIFEPFFTTKEVGKGTGLGLSMIQGIVEQSGGYIEVFSAPQCGTTFRIYLPKVEEAPAEAGKPPAVPAIGGEQTVLVVEDQAEVRRYASAALQSYGYRVIQAENAGAALLLCERGRERIDLVLTDVVMPNMSGRELADRLAKHWPGIKVLFMSGYTDDTIMQHGVLEGGATFIQKPFSPDQLAAKVREVLVMSDTAPRLLVADDETAVRNLLRTVLENDGYEVLEAADGKQVLKEVRAGRVDLVIMDLVMPEQEGLETIRILRKEVPGIGIIAMSGAFGGQFLETARLLGADAVLSKPVGTGLLLAKVAEVLQARR